MKIADDADEIDLDLTLEKYSLAKRLPYKNSDELRGGREGWSAGWFSDRWCIGPISSRMRRSCKGFPFDISTFG